MPRSHMVTMTLATLGLIVCQGSPSSAECIQVSPSWMKEHAQWVFAGRVTEKKSLEPGALQFTFDVAQVWKGDVRRKAVLYQLPSIDSVRLEEGREYVVFGQPLKREDWARFGVTSSAAFVIPDCSGAMQLRDDDESFRKLGRSRRPK